MNNPYLKFLLVLAVLVVGGFCVWYFSSIVLYVFFAMILSLLGIPVVNLLTKVHIKKFYFPRTLAAILAFAMILGVLFLFFYFLLPMLANEIRSLLAIDTTFITDGALAWTQKAENWLKSNGLLDRRDNLLEILMAKLKEFMGQFSITAVFGNTVQFVASICIAVFSVLFMTFFSLKDDRVFVHLLQTLVPISYRPQFQSIVDKTKVQLFHYFLGVFMEMLTMGLIEGLAAYFCGIPHALLIGCLGGLLNVIPYLGPVIAALLSAVIAFVGTLAVSPDAAYITFTILKVFMIFIGANLIDNFLLQPLIYSKSVKTHPLVIFIAILVGAQVGGILGMIFVVPIYTFLRIVFKEFFAQYFLEDSVAKEEITESIEKSDKK